MRLQRARLDGALPRAKVLPKQLRKDPLMPAKPTMQTDLAMRMGPGPNEKIGMKKLAGRSAPVEETQFGRLDSKLRFLGKRIR
jgi:hypothetical protein